MQAISVCLGYEIKLPTGANLIIDRQDITLVIVLLLVCYAAAVWHHTKIKGISTSIIESRYFNT